MNDIDIESGEDSDIKKRAVYALKVLKEYAAAMKTVRSSGVIDLDTYANGL